MAKYRRGRRAPHTAKIAFPGNTAKMFILAQARNQPGELYCRKLEFNDIQTWPLQAVSSAMTMVYFAKKNTKKSKDNERFISFHIQSELIDWNVLEINGQMDEQKGKM